MAVAKTKENYFDDVYDNISKLYGRAENLLSIVQNSEVADHDAFLAVMEPLIAQIEESTNQVAQDFADIIETGEMPSLEAKKRVNNSLREILEAVDTYRKMVESIEVTDE